MKINSIILSTNNKEKNIFKLLKYKNVTIKEAGIAMRIPISLKSYFFFRKLVFLIKLTSTSA